MLFVIFLLGFSFSWAYLPEEGNITANLGPYFFKTNFKEAKTKAGDPLMPGIGLIVNGDINDHSSLEIAMFHLNKRILKTKGAFSISEVSQVIHITMGYKWWLKSYLSTSLALYSAYPMGNSRVLYNDFPTGTELPTSTKYTTEYGFDLALQAEAWEGDKFDVEQDPSDGSIEAVAVRFYYEDVRIHFVRPLNARTPWPLIEQESGGSVFDNDGNFILNLKEFS